MYSSARSVAANFEDESPSYYRPAWGSSHQERQYARRKDRLDRTHLLYAANVNGGLWLFESSSRPGQMSEGDASLYPSRLVPP